MIDAAKLKQVLEGYKLYFPAHWKDEKYKWEAVKHFQEHWNIEAEDFADMLKVSLDKTFNLLASGYSFPRGMILNFAKADAERTRRMFQNLFDESQDLVERIEEFQQEAEAMRSLHDDGTWKNHYQNTNAISVYLWLRYPDKYYIYKYTLIRDIVKELNSDYMPKANGKAQSLVDGYKLYDEICAEIVKDQELCEMVSSALTDTCYSDPKFKTMTIDIGYYLSLFYLYENPVKPAEEDWFPQAYTPGLTTEQWTQLLQDETVFTLESLKVMKRMKDHGGQATCRQLSEKYGRGTGFYIGVSTGLAQRVVKKTGCPAPEKDTENAKWWPVLYVGRHASVGIKGDYMWKLRPELSEALEKADLSMISLYEELLPRIWKISHGVISEENRIIFEKRNAAVVNSDTRAKGKTKVTQGENFMEKMRKGDYFYLCYGNSIRFLCEMMDEEPTVNQELKDGWYERKYRVIADSKDTKPYQGPDKWWTPNDNSTCIEITESERPLFEELILQPYFGMSLDALYGKKDGEPGYWWLTANPQIWSFSAIRTGDEQSYTLYNENGNKRRIFQNFLDAKEGDCIIGYEANPVKKVVALGRITRANDGKAIYFEKTEGLSAQIDYAALRECPELEQMEFFTNPNGSLFKLTKDEYAFIMDRIREENPLKKAERDVKPYTKQDFLSEVFMTSERYDVLLGLLKNKLNIILQGAPGVGKTFAAKRLCYAMMGERDDSRIKLIQFHQSYSYEDFIMGYRPDGEGFKLTPGIFYEFCQRADNDRQRSYFMIIDEINRGNLSKILGETMMLIEKGYRDTKAVLAYSGKSFFVPRNLYIIGMMNTADRSLAMIDYALRRRFSFFDMEPGFASEGFERYRIDLHDETFDALIEQIKILNRDISQDRSLGSGFQIGHSYFCDAVQTDDLSAWLRSVVEFDILPMLREYWFDDLKMVDKWEKNLRGVFDDE